MAPVILLRNPRAQQTKTYKTTTKRNRANPVGTTLNPYSDHVVGWAMSDQMADGLTIDALKGN